ncbi:Ring finger domain [Carpediemonas membranifera]|uniref:Ring finger domain n=1 Tax=Carpediemonas membranifera TaxID=201153 RepID=A0A8J6DY36_9EUKA|nr:Ring finger domain [Carpediemonas membranifera]|eukprot:KAG9391464.1 Ring finger domain [Carpediemonas membranifera]
MEVPDVPNHLRCSICLQHFSSAVSIVPCGHTFCRACLLEHQRTQQSCPACRENITSAIPGHVVNECVSLLEGSCSKCQQKLLVGHLARHLRIECPQTLRQCPHDGCIHTCTPSELEAHIQSCPLKPTFCERCHECLLGSTDLHLCPTEPIKCQGCLQMVLRRDLDRHSVECLRGLVQCKFVHTGCTERVMRGRAAEHVRSQDWLEKHRKLLKDAADSCTEMPHWFEFFDSMVRIVNAAAKEFFPKSPIPQAQRREAEMLGHMLLYAEKKLLAQQKTSSWAFERAGLDRKKLAMFSLLPSEAECKAGATHPALEFLCRVRERATALRQMTVDEVKDDIRRAPEVPRWAGGAGMAMALGMDDVRGDEEPSDADTLDRFEDDEDDDEDALTDASDFIAYDENDDHVRSKTRRPRVMVQSDLELDSELEAASDETEVMDVETDFMKVADRLEGSRKEMKGKVVEKKEEKMDKGKGDSNKKPERQAEKQTPKPEAKPVTPKTPAPKTVDVHDSDSNSESGSDSDGLEALTMSGRPNPLAGGKTVGMKAPVTPKSFDKAKVKSGKPEKSAKNKGATIPVVRIIGSKKSEARKQKREKLRQLEKAKNRKRLI